MELTIRDGRPEDRAFVHDGFASYLAEERTRVPVLGIPDDFPDTYVPRLLEKVRSEGGSFLVAESGGERCGYVIALPKEPSAWDQTHARVAMIMELFVTPSHRRSGVGRRLFEEVEDRFAARGFDWVTLGMMALNERARSFYRAMGYRETYRFMGKPLRPAPPG
jgi:ribosomal protein S18 acetylase RimI-like enzyme